MNDNVEKNLPTEIRRDNSRKMHEMVKEYPVYKGDEKEYNLKTLKMISEDAMFKDGERQCD